MSIPFVIDNVNHRLADTLKQLLDQSAANHWISPRPTSRSRGIGWSKTAFNTSVRSACCSAPILSRGPTWASNRLQRVSKPGSRATSKPSRSPGRTLNLVEELIAFLQAEKVRSGCTTRGSSTPRRTCSTRTRSARTTCADRMRPFAAIVGSSNFTGPGLVSNRELNLVHRVILPTEDRVTREAARSVSYLEHDRERRVASSIRLGVEVADDARRFIKSEVGAQGHHRPDAVVRGAMG